MDRPENGEALYDAMNTVIGPVVEPVPLLDGEDARLGLFVAGMFWAQLSDCLQEWLADPTETILVDDGLIKLGIHETGLVHAVKIVEGLGLEATYEPCPEHEPVIHVNIKAPAWALS